MTGLSANPLGLSPKGAKTLSPSGSCTAENLVKHCLTSCQVQGLNHTRMTALQASLQLQTYCVPITKFESPKSVSVCERRGSIWQGPEWSRLLQPSLRDEQMVDGALQLPPLLVEQHVTCQQVARHNVCAV